MNCLDFKRLALSDPHSNLGDFVSHSHSCADCKRYLVNVQQMDADIASSLDVNVPDSFVAQLQLNQVLDNEVTLFRYYRRFKRHAIAASVAGILFVSGFMVSGFFKDTQGNIVSRDYESMISGIFEHMNDHPLTPLWSADKANLSVNTHLINYDGSMQLKYLENLQFSRICPLGHYKGLHAALETEEGVVTFAYIKGNIVKDLINGSYQGHSVRVKPLRGGNLIIISRTKKALVDADVQLEKAIYWDI